MSTLSIDNVSVARGPRNVVHDVTIRETGFLGVAEMLGTLDLQGKLIVEQPAVLEVRLLGHSKMKLFRTIGGHIRLLCRMVWARWGPTQLGHETPGPVSSRRPE